MRALSLLAVGVLTAGAHAGLSGNSQTYTDSTDDLFDNGLANLDIGTVSMSDDGVNLTISVETRGFANWTKYMIFLDTKAGGTTSNAWSRPVNLTSEIDYFVGSWVDQSSNNAQFVGYTGGFVTAVWVGRDDNTTMRKVTGGGAPAGIWQGFMSRTLPRLKAEPIPGGLAPPAVGGDPIGDLLDAPASTPDGTDAERVPAPIEAPIEAPVQAPAPPSPQAAPAAATPAQAPGAPRA